MAIINGSKYDNWRRLEMTANEVMQASYWLRKDKEPLNFEDTYVIGAGNLGFCDFSGANFKRAIIEGAYMYRINFRNANLEGAILCRQHLMGADFGGANLRNARLWEAELTLASFIRADLTRTEFHFSDLAGADFRRAKNLELATGLEKAFKQGVVVREEEKAIFEQAERKVKKYDVRKE